MLDLSFYSRNAHLLVILENYIRYVVFYYFLFFNLEKHRKYFIFYVFLNFFCFVNVCIVKVFVRYFYNILQVSINLSSMIFRISANYFQIIPRFSKIYVFCLKNLCKILIWKNWILNWRISLCVYFDWRPWTILIVL